MRVYRLYKSPDGNVVRLKMGFSWRAFFVSSFKALLQRTWLVLGIAAMFVFTTAWMGDSPTGTTRTFALAAVVGLFYLVFMVFCGFNGARWAGDSLRRRGYVLVGEERGRRSGGPSHADKRLKASGKA